MSEGRSVDRRLSRGCGCSLTTFFARIAKMNPVLLSQSSLSFWIIGSDQDAMNCLRSLKVLVPLV